MERASKPLQPVQGLDKVVPGHHGLDDEQGRCGQSRIHVLSFQAFFCSY
jgi:hypothetical protein